MRGNILPLIKFVAHFCGNKQIRAGQAVATYPGHAYRIVNQFMIAQCEQTFGRCGIILQIEIRHGTQTHRHDRVHRFRRLVSFLRLPCVKIKTGL